MRLPPLHLAIPIVVAAWAVMFEAWRFVGLVQAQPSNNDYRVFYLAAKAGLAWGWQTIYDPSKLAELNQNFSALGSSDISPLYTYLNPPLLAWLIALAMPLPFAAGLYVWTAVNIAAFAVAARRMFDRSRAVWMLAVVSALALWPTALAIERGQPELLVYSFVIASWWCANRGHERWAGVLLGLAGCLKPSDVVLLPAVYFVCGFRRTTLWWLATSAGALALFAAVLGPTGIGTYLGVTVWAASDPGFTAPPFFAPLGPRSSMLVGQATFAAIALIGVWFNRRSLRRSLAIGIAGTLASAVHLHEYDYVGLIVAAWFAVDESMSIHEVAWIGAGIVFAQLPAIGIRTPLVVWVPMWLIFLVAWRHLNVSRGAARSRGRLAWIRLRPVGSSSH